jgi:hypothetical protein
MEKFLWLTKHKPKLLHAKWYESKWLFILFEASKARLSLYISTKIQQNNSILTCSGLQVAIVW